MEFNPQNDFSNMTKPNPHTPPKRFQRTFEWFCDPDFYEELQGDLEERFYDNVEKWGLSKAEAIYRREVFMMFRPSVLKKIHLHTTYHTPMLKNYTLVAFRNILRNKLFSSINIIGLAISMSVGLLTISFLHEMYHYDDFHSKKARIYRLVNTQLLPDGRTSEYAATSLIAGKRLENDFTGYEDIVYLHKGFWGDLVKDEKTFDFSGLYASASFFKVFDFELLGGNIESVLQEPYTVVLTENTALKIFGNTDVIGEILNFRESEQYRVSGIVKDPPHNSHIRFDALGSLATLEAKYKDNKEFWRWNNMWSSYVYITVPDRQSLERVKANLEQIAAEENQKSQYKKYSIHVGLQPLTDIFPGKRLNNQLGVRMNKSDTQALIILALIVLLSACFNYTNLSIARALKRTKEVGVRRVIGAKGQQIFTQFTLEAIIISLISLCFAFCIFMIIRPEFISLNRMIRLTTSLELNTTIIAYFVLFACLMGLLAGFLPAIVFSRLKTISILKGNNGTKIKGVALRKVLIGLQFTLSMGFAILVTLAYKQYKFALNFDLGFQTENILNIETQGNDIQKLGHLIAQLPEVQGISYSSFQPSIGMLSSTMGKHISSNDSTTVYHLNVGTRYLENFGHKLLSGDNFHPELQEQQLIVNEQFIKWFGFKTMEDALGEQIKMYDEIYEIVGVVEDFHYGTVDNPIEPFVFMANPEEYYMINLKLQSEDMSATMRKLEDIWATIDPAHPFEATFYKEQIESAYTELSTTLKVFGLLAIVAISISILGLLGLATYQVETRIKEVAIRKVLGATVNNLVLLLSKNFIFIFVISTIIAVPISYFLFNFIIAPYAVYKISLGFWELSMGVIGVLAIALLIILSRTFKAAHANPVDNLRHE